jgi:wobble nucleotide-excising tRNase
MIESLEIKNFGSYKDFDWKSTVRDAGNNVAKFKRLNILYGRNYSGKTTLSRIIRSLETKVLPKNVDNPKFSISSNGRLVTSSQVGESGLVVRVYNKDFVDDNLSFLRGADGKVMPFAILGESNAEIKSEIEALENQLGSVEAKTGFRHEYQLKKVEMAELSGKVKAQRNYIEQLFTDKANKPPHGIKHNVFLKDPNYDSKKLKADIQKVAHLSDEAVILSDQALAENITSLKETALPKTLDQKIFLGKLGELDDEVRRILQAKIAPTIAIQDLLNNALLQSWAKSGIDLHQGIRETCGFCGNRIPTELWDRLSNHFNEESKALQESISIVRKKILSEQSILMDFLHIDDGAIYNSFKNDLRRLAGSLKFEIEAYELSLSALLSSLREREEDIFNPKELPHVYENTNYINQFIGLLNELIRDNNDKTASLEGDQKAARERVRLSTVAKFVRDISLAEKEAEVTSLDGKEKILEAELKKLEAEEKAKVQRIKELEAKLRDEKKGASQVNAYLTQFFGHDSIRLEAMPSVHDTRAYEFRVFRGESLAYNLSEGECSLLAFCYFMAKLNDVDSLGKEKIIYIDDPISSLDSNHIFFIYSLIESVLARPRQDGDGKNLKDADGNPIYPYRQLFISTHNLEFLKYLKRLSKPAKNHESFLITSGGESSKIALMPDYLRKYVTELNYLFGEVLTCADPMRAAKSYHCFYNFGNNLRKFLEAYLFFKYPFAIDDNRDYDTRVRMFFSFGSVEEALIQRLTNEFSHLGETIDRSAMPIDCAEISKVAIFVLREIKRNDADQYKHFLSSVGGVDPTI